MTEATKNGNSIAGSVVVILIAASTAAWFVYTLLFPQDIITFLVSIIYFPIAGIAIFIIYWRLRVEK